MSADCSVLTSKILQPGSPSRSLYTEKSSDDISGRFTEDSQSMISSNDPTIRTEITVPFDPVKNGEIVLFNINLLKTCEAFDVPFDAAIQQEARTLSSKKYVAVVDKASFFPQNQWCTCDLVLISHGLPRPRDGKLEDTSMCVPIFPTASHPLGRQPIHLKENKVLPWGDCYKSTTMRARVVVSATTDKEYTEIASITDDRIGDLMGFWRYQIEDKRRSNVLSEALKLDVPCNPVPASLSCGRRPVYRRQSSVRARRDSVFGSDEDFKLSVANRPSTWHEFQGIVNMFKTAPQRLHVDVWYDLASIANPPDPCDFFKEKEQVLQLLRRTQERIELLPYSVPRSRTDEMDRLAWLAIHEKHDDQDELSECSKSGTTTPPPDIPLPSYLRHFSTKLRVRRAMTMAIVSLRRIPPRLTAWMRRRGGYRRHASTDVKVFYSS